MKPDSSGGRPLGHGALDERVDAFAGLGHQRIGLGDLEDRPGGGAARFHAGQERLAMDHRDRLFVLDDRQGTAVRIANERRQRRFAETVRGKRGTTVSGIAESMHGGHGCLTRRTPWPPPLAKRLNALASYYFSG